MRTKLFTLRFSPTLGGFDDAVVQDFVRDKELLSLREHFFVVHDVPHVLCIVSWQEMPVSLPAMQAARTVVAEPRSGNSSIGGRHRDSAPDLMAGLSESDRVLFQTIRRWRGETARAEGGPHYMVLTNRQLVEVVTKKPDSPTALSNVPGFGPAKVERYGKALLAVLHGHTSVVSSPANEPAAPTAPKVAAS